MEFSNFESIITLIIAVLGAVGGIPQLLKFVNVKPHIELSNVSFSKLPDNKYNLHLEIENRQKRYRRNKDATYLQGDWFFLDKNNIQLIGYLSQMITPHLLVGKKVLRDFQLNLHFAVEGNPHTIVIQINSNEGFLKKRVITYEEKP